MHIGLFLYGDLNLPTGGFLYDRMVVQGLQRRGHRVTVLRWPWRGYLTGLVEGLLGLPARHLARTRLDVLVEDELAHPSLALRRSQVPFPRVALVHLLRSPAAPSRLWRGLYRHVERAYLSGVDAAIYVSHYNRRLARHYLGVHKPWAVAYPGGDHLGPPLSPEEVLARSRRPGPLRVLFLGQLIPRKGLHVLLQALRHLPRGTWRLTVAGGALGRSPYPRQMRDLARRLGFTNTQVIWLGHVGQGQVRSLLREHHVLAVPSRMEGYALVYLEALAHGLPVIGARRSGARELIRPGENGFLVPPEAPQAVAQALEQLLDRTRLARMSLDALATFQRHPRWADAVQVFEDFLTALVRG